MSSATKETKPLLTPVEVVEKVLGDSYSIADLNLWVKLDKLGWPRSSEQHMVAKRILRRVGGRCYGRTDEVYQVQVQGLRDFFANITWEDYDDYLNVERCKQTLDYNLGCIGERRVSPAVWPYVVRLIELQHYIITIEEDVKE